MEPAVVRLLVLALCLSLSRADSLLKGDNGTAVPIWALSASIAGGKSTICNKTFADANGTGIINFNPNVAQGPQAGQPDNLSGSTLPSMFAVTVANPGFTNPSNDSSSYTLWYNTNGANYSNDYALGYDVCAIAGLSLNYNTQLRGQTDNGSCLSTLDQPCISAIKAFAAQQAAWLTTPSPGPDSNLTNTSLPGICRTLATEISNNLPQECSYFFQNSAAAIGWPLTSYGDSYDTALFPDCTLNGTWNNMLGIFNNASEAVYDAWFQAVTPVIAIWMPVASYSNQGAQVTIAETVAELACGHIDTVVDGSYEPPAAPSPTPVAYNSTSNSNNSTSNATNATTSSNNEDDGLSGGAIGGIVVGVVLGIALILGLAWLWRRQTKRKRKTTAELSATEISDEQRRHELGGAAKGELPGEGPKEKYGRQVSELDGQKPGELEGSQGRGPVELPT
ncbi:uncharacterized protein MYCFIDRAFT_212946 [Pseudocercospora fijiensis CIRAD86]|uniref:Uncharacterized protein n=1 Tax=Pseudocercospora fijiensis (strain CIRAD86) TaxID=383855 RepID=N1Q7I1_PSEFD|nr:uncharacterized protein MYCFIDRAFT_212946 [Pseudocercospora fijiensis CIRAD86]EME87596.1 hypothetical protein MYCFIDRAFT_212946 [Pseudocercospora fijiensis CIRAD86]